MSKILRTGMTRSNSISVACLLCLNVSGPDPDAICPSRVFQVGRLAPADGARVLLEFGFSGCGRKLPRSPEKFGNFCPHSAWISLESFVRNERFQGFTGIGRLEIFSCPPAKIAQ